MLANNPASRNTNDYCIHHEWRLALEKRILFTRLNEIFPVSKLNKLAYVVIKYWLSAYCIDVGESIHGFATRVRVAVT